MGSRVGRLRVLGAAVGLGVVLTACSTGGSEDPEAPEEPSASAPAESSGSPDAAEEDPALLGAPEVGSCRDLTSEQLQQRAVDALVPCDGPHTSRVTDVVVLPDGLTPSSPDDDLIDFTNEVCTGSAIELLGGEVGQRRTSLFGRAFFRPTRAEEAEGANWVTCDVYAADGSDTIPLPDSEPFLDDAETLERYTRCVRLGDDDEGQEVSCASEHDIETGEVLEFPTLEAAERVDLSQRCMRNADVVSGENLSVGFLDPARSTFDADEVFIVICLCFDTESVA